MPSSPETVVEAKVWALSEEGMVKRGDWRQRGSVEMGDEEQPGEAEAGTRDIDHGRDRTLGSKLDHRVLNFFIGTISVEFTKNGI